MLCVSLDCCTQIPSPKQNHAAAAEEQASTSGRRHSWVCRAWVGSSWPRQSQGWEAEPGAGAGGHVGAHSDAFAQRACAMMLAPAWVVTAQGVLDAAVGMGPVLSPRFFALWEQCRCWHCPVWPCRGWRCCGVGAPTAAGSSRLCISLY